MKLEIELLNTFLYVATQQSISRTAEILHLTQSAVSKRILGLEQSLSTKLFDRIGHKLLLTEAGKILVPRAKIILDEINYSRLLIQNLGQNISGNLTIGTSHHIGLHRLPPILREYTRRYPDVMLNINFLDSEKGCQGVETGELELGIVTLPLQAPKALQTLPVWIDPLVLVVSCDHKLANTADLDLSLLSQHKAILPGVGTYTRAILEQALAPLKLSLQSSMSTNYLETIKMMVSIGLGWSILPQSMCDSDLHRLTIPGLSLSRELGIVTHIDRTLSNAANALVDLISK